MLFYEKSVSFQNCGEPICFLRREGLLLLYPEASLGKDHRQSFRPESCLASSLYAGVGSQES